MLHYSVVIVNTNDERASQLTTRDGAATFRNVLCAFFDTLLEMLLTFFSSSFGISTVDFIKNRGVSVLQLNWATKKFDVSARGGRWRKRRISMI
jgi:hypothetical protein